MDEIPVYGLDSKGHKKKSDGYSIFCVTELDWSDVEQPGKAKLRLVRALSKNTSVAWRLLFDELDYCPDIIVTDAATSILLAVRRHFPLNPPLLVPSTFHLRRALVTNALGDALKGETPETKALDKHLGKLGRDDEAMTSVEG